MASQHASTPSWLETRLPICAAWRSAVTEYAAEREQPYLATLPALILAALAFISLSGAVLAVYYVAAEGRAYDSLQFIERSVNFGWLIRSFHATGATMLFGATYILLFRALLSGSYKSGGDLAWFLKLKLFILLLITGWLGFVMQDGAVSYWTLSNAALAGARLPGFPGAIANWVFGGPAGPGTLARMEVLHIILALLMFAAVFALIIANRIAAPAARRRLVAFHPYYTSQYFAALVIFAVIYAVLAFFAPHIGEPRLNAVAGNPLVVPPSLTVPWYLLPISAIGGIVPNTLGSVILVIAALAVLYALPWLNRAKPGLPTGLAYKILTWLLALDVLALAITAAAPPSVITEILSAVFILWYFLHFLVFTPLATGVL